MGDLPAGASIPCTFEAGQPLTAAELNDLQLALLSLILNHTHSGNAPGSQQGVQLGSEAIKADAILGDHIKENVIRRSHIQSGAVGSSQIDDKQISAGHLQPDAITTAAIRNANVTMEKLSDDIVDLLHAPSPGATTYCYCTYFPGRLSFPSTPVKWYNFLLDNAVGTHDIDVNIIGDDGRTQPINSVLNEQIVKQLTPLAKSLSTKIASQVSAKTASTASSLHPESASDTTAPAYSLLNLQQAQPMLTNVAASPILDERSRIAVQIAPKLAGIDSDNLAANIMTLNPGSGSNATFSDKKEPIVLQPGIIPSPEVRHSLEQLLYNYDIDDLTILDKGLNQQLIDFLNNPQLLPIGYMTGASRNVASVTRMKDSAATVNAWVRVNFITPYASTSSYAVSVTPEMKTTESGRHPLIPMVLRRSASYVDIAFATLQETYADDANFSLAIQGELVTA